MTTLRDALTKAGVTVPSQPCDICYGDFLPFHMEGGICRECWRAHQRDLEESGAEYAKYAKLQADRIDVRCGDAEPCPHCGEVDTCQPIYGDSHTSDSQIGESETCSGCVR